MQGSISVSWMLVNIKSKMLPDELEMLLNWIKFKREKPSMRDWPVVDEIKLKHLRS